MILDKSTEGIQAMFSRGTVDAKHPVLRDIGVEPASAQFYGLCKTFGLNPSDPKSKDEWNRIRKDFEDAALKNAIKNKINISAVESKVDKARLDAIKAEVIKEGTVKP